LYPDKLSEVEKAAELCKADLTTAMVYEFPELQGIMGREYAKAQGEDDEVAKAIDEHYRPKFSGDELPSGDVATAVALADKIETICGTFALGHIPSGSEDPFALRRHAIGVVRILLTDYGKKLSLDELISIGTEPLPDNVVNDRRKLKGDVYGFFKSRLQHDLLSRKLPYDVIEAVLVTSVEHLPDALKRCEALAEMKKEDYCENLSISFKRASKIILGHTPTDLDESMLLEPAEKELLASLKKREKNIFPLLEAKDFEGALKEVAEIRTAVDNFFDGVMVIVDDEKVKANRLSLLQRVVNLFDELADFSKLVY
jgi:glycyl-tRNA synthetase beta chain